MNLITQVLALNLFNPISGADVTADDVATYVETCEGAPSVEGFRVWLAA